MLDDRVRSKSLWSMMSQFKGGIHELTACENITALKRLLFNTKGSCKSNLFQTHHDIKYPIHKLDY